MSMKWFTDEQVRRPLRGAAALKQHSTVDSIIYGRDIDRSGDDPWREYMQNFGLHAGRKTHNSVPFHFEPTPRFHRGPGLNNKSVVDELLYGRDLDQSGLVPHFDQMRPFGHHAGLTSEDIYGDGRTRSAGLSHSAVMDTVLYGRDLDGSGDHPHQDRMKRFEDHAGIRYLDQKISRQGQRLGNQSRTAVHQILHGDRDSSDFEVAHSTFMTSINKGAAGLPIKFADGHEPRKPRALSMRSSVGNVVFQQDKEHFEDFMDFGDYAGKRSGGLVSNSMLSPRRQSTTSTPEKTGSSRSENNSSALDRLRFARSPWIPHDNDDASSVASSRVSSRPSRAKSSTKEEKTMLETITEPTEVNDNAINKAVTTRLAPAPLTAETLKLRSASDSSLLQERTTSVNSIIKERVNPFGGSSRRSHSSAASTCSRPSRSSVGSRLRSNSASSLTSGRQRWR